MNGRIAPAAAAAPAVKWSCRGVGEYDEEAQGKLEAAWEQFVAGTGPSVCDLDKDYLVDFTSMCGHP